MSFCLRHDTQTRLLKVREAISPIHPYTPKSLPLGDLPNTIPASQLSRESSLRQKQNTNLQQDSFPHESRPENGRLHVRMATFILLPFVKKIVHSKQVFWPETRYTEASALGALFHISPASQFSREPPIAQKQNTKPQQDSFYRESRPENSQFHVRMARFTRAVDFNTCICANFV